MTRWLLHLETQQPLLIGSRFGNMAQNFQGQLCIPGQTLRGALAAAVVQRLGEEDPAFQACFGEDKLACGPQWAVAGTHAPDTSDVWGPLPFTARACKRQVDHAQRDALLDLAFDPPPVKDLECSQCRFPFAKWRGQAHLTAKGTAQELHIQRQLITRTAVGPQMDSVVHSQLFNLKPLSEGQHFAGYVFDPEDRLRKLLPSMETLYIGMGQTRGFGRVQATWIRADQPMGGLLKDRVKAFEAMLNQKDRHRPKSDATTLTRVTLNLTSPLLLRDAWGNDRLALEDQDFHAINDQLKWGVEAVASEATWVGGWHGLLGLPHNQRQALAPGSVFALTLRGDRGQALAALETLETFGLGEGFANGFGHLLIAHPFHAAYASKREGKTDPAPAPSLKKPIEALLDNEKEARKWKCIAEKAWEAKETPTQIRGLENLVNKSYGVTQIINMLHNQISRLKTNATEKIEWRQVMIKKIQACLSQFPYPAQVQGKENFAVRVQHQKDLMRLIRTRMAVFSAWALLLMRKDNEDGTFE